jgi:uncharacterized protein (UPF0548 family)
MRLARRSGLAGLISVYETATLTYTEVGGTQHELPDGYSHTRRGTRLGSGRVSFGAAADAVLSWQMHRRSGLAVAAEGPAAEGMTVILGMGRPLVLVMPCRVLYVVNEPDRRGFAYGSLTDHPEQGEESFVVVIDADDTVRLEITAFSRPGNTLIRASGVVGRRIQARATRRYVDALSKGRLGSGND